ncbi:hypothetical protein C8F01DRAFT_670301 [Mycena amicta]|nr:hypothetical protein C8F01DRAFT_670301 [Mycena amicta]
MDDPHFERETQRLQTPVLRFRMASSLPMDPRKPLALPPCLNDSSPPALAHSRLSCRCYPSRAAERLHLRNQARILLAVEGYRAHRRRSRFQAVGVRRMAREGVRIDSLLASRDRSQASRHISGHTSSSLHHRPQTLALSLALPGLGIPSHSATTTRRRPRDGATSSRRPTWSRRLSRWRRLRSPSGCFPSESRPTTVPIRTSTLVFLACAAVSHWHSVNPCYPALRNTSGRSVSPSLDIIHPAPYLPSAAAALDLGDILALPAWNIRPSTCRRPVLHGLPSSLSGRSRFSPRTVSFPGEASSTQSRTTLLVVILHSVVVILHSFFVIFQSIRRHTSLPFPLTDDHV